MTSRAKAKVSKFEPRPIHVYRLDLISAERDAAMLEAECGKGAYVRAIARDLGRALGCYGHVVELRRTRVGPFSADAAVALDRLARGRGSDGRALLPVEAGLAEMPLLPVDRAGAAILRRGQKLLLRGARAAARAGLRRLLRHADRLRRRRGRLFRLDPGVQPARDRARPLTSTPRTPSPTSPALRRFLEHDLGDAIVVEQQREIEPGASLH